MTKRIVLGTLMILILAGLLTGEAWFSAEQVIKERNEYAGAGFIFLAGCLLSLALIEITRMAKNRDIHVSRIFLCLILWAIISQSIWYPWVAAPMLVFILIFIIALAGTALIQALKRASQQAIANIGAGCFLVLYIGLGGFFLVELRILGRDSSSIWGQIQPVVLLLATVKSCDIGAYFTGRFLGRHHWVPSISPKKTWEGLLGGLIFSVIVCSLIAPYSDIIKPGLQSIVFGLLVGLTGQLGDLLESMIKRDAGVKDSGQILPEFGGVMDLLDSPLAAAPIGYVLLLAYGQTM